jgi:hypothetical protein
MIIRFRLLLLIFTIFCLISLLNGSLVNAATGDSCNLKKSGLIGIPTWYKYLQGQETETLTNKGVVSVCTVKLYGSGASSSDLSSKPVESGNALAKNFSSIGLAIVEILMRLLIYISLIWGIWGAYEIILSGGNSQGFKSGIDRIRNAAIGLIIGLLSTSIVIFVAKKVI